MYVPDAFTMNPGGIVEFIRQYPFSIIISTTPDGESIASHIPLIVTEKEGEVVLEGHVSTQNRHANFLRDDQKILVIIQGENAYISASVYEKPNASTWNYQSVHLYGTVTENQVKKEHVKQLTNQFEGKRTRSLPFEQLPAEMVESYLSEIHCFRIEVYKMEAAGKLSQNRSNHDFIAIIDDLKSQSGKEQVIQSMEEARRNKKSNL